MLSIPKFLNGNGSSDRSSKQFGGKSFMFGCNALPWNLLQRKQLCLICLIFFSDSNDDKALLQVVTNVISAVMYTASMSALHHHAHNFFICV